MSNNENSPVIIELPEGQYARVERCFRKVFKQDVADYVQSSPRPGYIGLGGAIADVLAPDWASTFDPSLDHFPAEARNPDNDNIRYARDRARQMYTPPIVLEAREVVVNVVKRRTPLQLLRREEPETEEMLRFTVPPLHPEWPIV